MGLFTALSIWFWSQVVALGGGKERRRVNTLRNIWRYPYLQPPVACEHAGSAEYGKPFSPMLKQNNNALIVRECIDWSITRPVVVLDSR